MCKDSAGGTACGLEAALASEFVFDLAIDALKLPGEICDHQFQGIFACVDDAPKLGALRGAEVVVGESNPRLHNVPPPQAGTLAVEFDSSVWHALDPQRRAASDVDNATRRYKFPASSWHG